MLIRLRNKAIHYLIKFIDFFWPKNSSLVLFGQKRGGYSDNSRALFEYMRQHSPMRALWLTDNLELVDNIHFFDAASWKGFVLAMRAKTFIVSHGVGDISYSASFSSQKVHVVVWHGIPLKRIALLDANLEGSKRAKWVEKEIAKYDRYIAASEAEAETLRRCRKLPDTSKMVVTGLPRNDRLFNAPEIEKLNVAPELLDKLKKKVILYAPTFRDNRETRFFPFANVDFGKIRELLESKDAYLLFRPHPNDTKNRQRLEAISQEFGERFVLADNRLVSDVAEILPYIDTVITDYSSIYLDLLLLNCPCVFIPYDLEQYERERGFLYDYDSVTPGPKVDSLEEFLSGIQSCLSDASYYKNERERVTRLFHQYQDDGASRRVCELVERVAREK